MIVESLDSIMTKNKVLVSIMIFWPRDYRKPKTSIRKLKIILKYLNNKSEQSINDRSIYSY